MLLTVYTLPQLAVSAKLLCLLMVVICGAVPSMVRSVRLYNDCSLSYMGIDMKGRVLAVEREDDSLNRFQNLTIKSMDYNVALMIYAEASKRFLCFNRKWKPVGLKNFNKKMCLFYEEMLSSGYTRFRSANQSHFVGFNKRGKPLRGNAAKPNSKDEKCFNFVKNDTNFNINQHNRKIAGGNNQSSGNPVFPSRGSRRGPKRSRNNKDNVRHSRNKKRPS
ncbi:fibroblast growth factor 18 [Anabrus simplex]|uniref:fibroblast growth factor 18 n=1 Tax=Anabrus simplex TaxID=316456 RepID=UPI0034DD52C1